MTLNFFSKRIRNLKNVRCGEKKVSRQREKIGLKKRDKSEKNSPADAANTTISNAHNDNGMISDKSIPLMDKSPQDMLASYDDWSHNDGVKESPVSQTRVNAIES